MAEDRHFHLPLIDLRVRRLVSYMTLKEVVGETPQEEVDEEYARQVRDFVKNGENRSYFLETVPVPEMLEAHSRAADIVNLKSGDSGFLAFPAVTNFGDQPVSVKEGLLTRMRYCGRAFGPGGAVLPENVEDALVQHWIAWSA